MGRQVHLTDANLPDYLRRRGLLDPDEAVEVQKAGDGNINWVRRARIDSPRGNSLVVKQARPALERFPEYRVSTERLVFEARYYEVVRPFDSEGILPVVHGFDEEERVLVLEDLGDAERLDRALERGADVSAVAASLGAFLGRIHAATRDAALAARFANDEMRRLHGDHIFVLPFRTNDFPLPPELRARADALASDAELVALADAACARYLEPRGALVHGDVQAGNVLLAARGPKLLDAEIAHVGDPAFDVGTLLAHLLLPVFAAGRPAGTQPAVAAAWSAYLAAHPPEGRPGFAAVARYAGLELMRRTIGAARVAAVEPVASGLAVTRAAERLIRTPPGEPSEL